MRWRLCKELKVSVDDKIFKNINDAQLIWYQTQILLDDKENYELLRDVAEHNAMFWNPEAVDQIREARKNTFTTSTEDFEDSVKNIFGRELTPDAPAVLDLEQALRQERDNTNEYLNMNLDEIKFTPIRGN